MRLKKYVVAYDSFAFELLNERMMFEKLCCCHCRAFKFFHQDSRMGATKKLRSQDYVDFSTAGYVKCKKFVQIRRSAN